MLKALGWIIKISLFSVAVLLAGDWVHWNGKTLSQHVRAQVGQAEHTNTAAYMRGLTRRVTEDAREGFDKKIKQLKLKTSSAEIIDRTEMQAAAPVSSMKGRLPEQNSGQTMARTEEPIAPSERQKLKALIHELNSSHD